METLSTRGRVIRALVTALGVALLLVGTAWGDDDHFPFGPFRMFSTSSPSDAPVADLRVEIVDARGATVVLTERNSGIRRAEIEGQLTRYSAEPSRLRQVSEAYAERNPEAPAAAEVRVVIRWHGVEHSRPTGTYKDETVVRWVVP